MFPAASIGSLDIRKISIPSDGKGALTTASSKRFALSISIIWYVFASEISKLTSGYFLLKSQSHSPATTLLKDDISPKRKTPLLPLL